MAALRLDPGSAGIRSDPSPARAGRQPARHAWSSGCWSHVEGGPVGPASPDDSDVTRIQLGYNSDTTRIQLGYNSDTTRMPARLSISRGLGGTTAGRGPAAARGHASAARAGGARGHDGDPCRLRPVPRVGAGPGADAAAAPVVNRGPGRRTSGPQPESRTCGGVAARARTPSRWALRRRVHARPAAGPQPQPGFKLRLAHPHSDLDRNSDLLSNRGPRCHGWASRPGGPGRRPPALDQY
jgi:hypothetical protein